MWVHFSKVRSIYIVKVYNSLLDSKYVPSDLMKKLVEKSQKPQIPPALRHILQPSTANHSHSRIFRAKF
jgi:hypothetical protein